MRSALHRLLLGTARARSSRVVDAAVVGGAFAVTFLAYATELFAVSGGVVFIAEQAALVGLVGAVVLGSRRAGLATAWAGSYAALLGWHAESTLLGLSDATPAARLGAVLQPDGLAFLGAQALVIGTLAWGAGRLARGAVATAAGQEAGG
jgi:hypothetical protein